MNADFDPTAQHAKCEQYLSRSLGKPARLVGATPLTKSTRGLPWRLDVDIQGARASYVLRLDERNAEHEVKALRIMEKVPIPAPRVYGWEPDGATFGVPGFLCDFIDGESLLPPMLRHEQWAENLYIDTVIQLQSITRDDLDQDNLLCDHDETAFDVLETAFDFFRDKNIALAVRAYEELIRRRPPSPPTLFSNGDLYPDNLLIREKELVGVIDWEMAGFSDPIYEFLLPFFVCPSLRGRGTEERYCRRMDFDPDWLVWYRGLELFDIWHWVEKKGKPFAQRTAESLAEALTRWLSGTKSQ